ncbi:MAG: transglycosylase domain-containing protein [Gemmatimonadales bacterium]
MSQSARFGSADVDADDGREVQSHGARSLLRGRWGLVLLLACAGVAGVVHEARTSRLQASVFSHIASSFGFTVEEGVSDRIRFPAGGPHDERLGYSRIPELTERLDSLGFELTHQARVTPSLLRWMQRGVYPVHESKAAAGLRVEDESGRTLVREAFPLYAYQDFEAIPELVWRTLLHIESRGMLDDGDPTRNPAVEWHRLAMGAARMALRELGAEGNVPGGSTLATQIEKYRHSPGGITASPGEKLRQMLAASLRAYGDGPSTYEERRRIVTEFLNSVPLAGQVGHGEVVGLGEGLWAWYGTPFAHANDVLTHAPGNTLAELQLARTYRQVLALLVAQRRPTYYLASAEGQRALTRLTNAYLGILERDGVIPARLAALARSLPSDPVRRAAPSAGPSEDPELPRSASSVRANLLSLIGARGLYEMDRLDLTAMATVDAAWDAAARDVLRDLGDPEFLAAEGFREASLLAAGDPSEVFYSVLLVERTEIGNVVRIEADNFPGDMSFSDGSRLELGSTAKLRTLTTYMEVIEEIHARLASAEADSLRVFAAREDVLTRWVAAQLLRTPGATLTDVLEAALERRYSASPRERFLTGGTEMTFSNFDARYDQEVLTVREAFRSSVNLPFVRLMRDLVDYELGRLGVAEVLTTDQPELRRAYLMRFADHEGAQYVRRFHRRYVERTGPEIFSTLLADRGLSATQVAWAVRTVAPDAPYELFADLVRTYGSDAPSTEERMLALHARTDPTTLPLSDLGYLARIHPLELWVAGQRLDHPAETLQVLLVESRDVMMDVYGWLLRTSRPRAQDVRIQTVLEMEAFQQIHARWRRLGYPFEDLAPSLGTAIGSSGDRPLALTELVSVILDDGRRHPTVRVAAIRAAEDTPFETRFRRRPEAGQRVLGTEVAGVLRRALLDVVEQGTGRRARGALTGADGEPLTIGGKTGTGDNRVREYDARGRVLATRVVNRTASFVFVAGDRYTGVVTAFVQGPRAGEYRFTSALPTQVLRALGQRLGPLGAAGASVPDGDTPATPLGPVPPRVERLVESEGHPQEEVDGSGEPHLMVVATRDQVRSP